MAWKYLKGDGLEEALQHEQHESCWVSLKEVNDVDDVLNRVLTTAPKVFITKSDVVDLVAYLLQHLSAIRRNKRDKLTAKYEAVGSIVAATARSAAELAAGARASNSSVKFGTTWGGWTYKNDEFRGPSIEYLPQRYPIDLARVGTPAELGTWVNHLAHKDWLSPEDLQNAITALISCFINGELPDGWHRVDGAVRRINGADEPRDSGPIATDASNNAADDGDDIPF
jgi:hypothetical protein